MTDATIVKSIIDALVITPAEFSRKIGIAQANVSGYLSGNRSLSVSVKRKIIETFPQVNPQYVLRGEGDIMLPGGVGEGTPPYHRRDVGGVTIMGVGAASSGNVVRLLAGYASAGALGGDTEGGIIEGLVSAPFLPSRPEGYVGIRISGDSMAPNIRHGAIVILPGKPTAPPLTEGAVYIIITAHVCTIKRVRLSATPATYALTPDNPAHPIIEVAAADIVQAWPVLWAWQEVT